MKVLVIHNRRSGYGDNSIYDFVRSYAEDGDSVTIRTFDGNTPFSELCRGADEYDFVVACGGDGTVASVCYELRNSDIPVLIYPSGTANLTAESLHSSDEAHALVKTVDAGLTQYFDMGEIQTAVKTVGFINMAGCGFDSIIMEQASKYKQLMGPIAYFQAAATNAFPQVSEFSLTIDGEVVNSSGIGIVIANFSKIQFDILVANENQPRDGMLDVVVLQANNALELLPTLMAKVADKSGELSNKIGGLEVYQGREIKIEAHPAMRIEHDGEFTEMETPFIVRCLPEAARLIITEEAYKEFSDDILATELREGK